MTETPAEATAGVSGPTRGEGGGAEPDAPGSIPPTRPRHPGSIPPTRPRHTARWIALIVLVIAAGLTAVLATRPSATADQVYSPLVDKQAPPIAGLTVDGGHYALPSVPGKYVVVNFFASWCEPCQEEGPQLVAFQFQHQKAGDATMLSVVLEDTTSAARNYQATLGATWPTMADPTGSIRLAYGVRAPPSTFIIAPSGRVVAYYDGPVTAQDLDTIIQQLKDTKS